MNISIAYSRREYLPDKKTKPLLTNPLFLSNFHDPHFWNIWNFILLLTEDDSAQSLSEV